MSNINPASINTSNEQRDEHLRYADFFATESHPNMKFVSTKVEKVDDDTFNLFGDQTIKDSTNQVKLSVEHNGVAIDYWGQREGQLFLSAARSTAGTGALTTMGFSRQEA